MNLQGRSLTQGLTGADVTELHGELTQLGYSIPAAETGATSFGAGTLSAVQQFQTDNGLPANGTVDAATAAALSSVTTASIYTVTGTVASPVRPGVGGLAVAVVDKNVGGDQPVASGTTDATGHYSVSGVISLRTLLARHKTAPDLQARVSAGTAFLAASNVAYNAAKTVALDVALPSGASGLPSEYETLSASLRRLYTGQFRALQETAQQQDITFLANKSGWDARAIALAALADQFSALSASPPAAATSPTVAGAAAAAAPPATLQAEFYYALFRAGLPANADMLFQASLTSVQGVWQNAIAQGVIPQALSASVPAAVKTFQALSAAHVLTAAPVVGPSTLQAMLAASSIGQASQQQQFAELLVQYRDNPAGLWPAVTTALGAARRSSFSSRGNCST